MLHIGVLWYLHTWNRSEQLQNLKVTGRCIRTIRCTWVWIQWRFTLLVACSFEVRNPLRMKIGELSGKWRKVPLGCVTNTNVVLEGASIAVSLQIVLLAPKKLIPYSLWNESPNLQLDQLKIKCRSMNHRYSKSEGDAFSLHLALTLILHQITALHSKVVTKPLFNERPLYIFPQLLVTSS